MGLLQRLFAAKPSEAYPVPTDRDIDVALFDGTDSMEVVGESNYQPALRATWDACNDSGQKRRVSCYAILQPQPENQYDANAVAVWGVPGGLAGYLSRNEAARWHQPIAEAWKREGKPVAVPANVVTRHGDIFGLWLDWPDDFAE